MNLDFTTLSGPPAQQAMRKPWGQAGTPGTPMLTRTCVQPVGGDTAGTAGDKGLTLPTDIAVVAAAATTSGFCPPMSPTCPQGTEGSSPNEINVSPVSPLVPGLENQDESGGNFDHEDFEERAAIMEFDGGMTRPEAEAAARAVIAYARRNHADD